MISSSSVADMRTLHVFLYNSMNFTKSNMQYSDSGSNMGSVGNNFECPICGRMGHGSCAFDHIGYPTCIIYNFKDAGIANEVLPAELISQQLSSIAGNQEYYFSIYLVHILY